MIRPTTERAYLLTSFDTESQETFSDLVPQARAPTRLAVDNAIAAIRTKLASDAAKGLKTELYFFYAGHGDAKDGVGYINLDGSLFTRPEFLAVLSATPRADRTHVIVDACKSYYFVAGRGPGGTREPHTTRFAGPDPIPGVGFVLSTSNGADSHEWAALAGGIVSHEVRSALLGAADVDADGAVDYHELAAFVAVANEPIEFPRYRPQVYVRAPIDDSNAPIYRHQNVPGATYLSLPEDETGRVSIADHRGLRYVDFNKASHASQIALLQPRRYEVRWRGRTYLIPEGSGARGLASLRPGPKLTVAARGEVHKAFENLFTAPFSSDVVRGYRLADAQAPVLVPTPIAEDRFWPKVVIGAGILAAVTGAVLVGVGGQKRGDVTSAPQTERQGLVDEADRLQLAGGITIGVGTVSALVALILD